MGGYQLDYPYGSSSHLWIPFAKHQSMVTMVFYCIAFCAGWRPQMKLNSSHGGTITFAPAAFQLKQLYFPHSCYLKQEIIQCVCQGWTVYHSLIPRCCDGKQMSLGSRSLGRSETTILWLTYINHVYSLLVGFHISIYNVDRTANSKPK